MLPAGRVGLLKAHLEHSRRQHELDLSDGAGSVRLVDALHRKYPRAAWEWGWQWVFPATRLHRDPHTRQWQRQSARVRRAAGLQRRRPSRACREAGDLAFVAP